MFRRALVGVVAVTVWLVNPMLACNSSNEGTDDEYAFGESEMRAAVEGTYVGQLPTTGETVTLELAQSKLGSNGTTSTQSTRRVLCGTRTFVQPAAACMSMTTMPLQGRIVSSGTTIASGDLAKGNFLIDGRILDYGMLSLTLADGATVTASYDAAEGMRQWQLVTVDGKQLTLELERSPQ